MSVDFARPLLKPTITRGEHDAIVSACAEREANVVSAMLNPETSPAIVSKYMSVAMSNIELDLRSVGDNIVGAKKADMRVPVALNEMQHTRRADLLNRMQFRGDMESRYGAGGSGWYEALDAHQKQVVDSIDALQRNIDAMEKLANYLTHPPSQLSSPEYLGVVARATFFHTLDSSRSLKAVVMDPDSAARFKCHRPLEPHRALEFFRGLTKCTARFSRLESEPEQYLDELRSTFYTGLPRSPLSLDSTPGQADAAAPRQQHQQ